MTDDRKALYEAEIPRWRSLFWASQLPRGGDLRGFDILLFGVFAGQSTLEWIRILEERHIRYDRIVCFDSFAGIPKELQEPVRDEWDPERSETWKAFNAGFYFGTDATGALLAYTDRISNALPEGVELLVVQGFFKDSLNDESASKMRPAAIVDVDVDIYSSTKEVLSWLFTHDLLVPQFTQVGYDDWGATPGHKSMSDGESRAHREITDEHGVRWSRLTATQRDEQVVFQYEGPE